MASDLDLVARLLSYEQGHAVPKSSHRHLAIHDDALVFCPIMMAGEESTIHALAIGRIGTAPKIRVVPDPRLRADQFKLFEWLAKGFEHYFQSCRDSGVHPQIWVSSRPVLTLLDTLAERLRYNRDYPVVRRFGELLTYATDRLNIAGQQALIDCSSALTGHWLTGQSDSDDEHLGALLAWLEGDRNGIGDLLEKVRIAEQQPCGSKTSPDFDRDILNPLVTEYNVARRDGANPSRLTFLAGQIEDALAPIVLNIYEKTQKAIQLLKEAELPELIHLGELEARETDSFQSFMKSRDKGYRMSLRDKPKASVFKMAEREDAEENYQAAILASDSVAQAEAILSGKALEGKVTNPRKVKLAPRRFDLLFELISDQEILHLREGSKLSLKDDPRYQVTVVSLQRRSGHAIISLKVTRGKRTHGLPKDGAKQFWLLSAPDWHRLRNERKQFKERLAKTPWTHNSNETAPVLPSRAAPVDPLALVEALR
ncbi:MAG: hypothetical protein P1V97_38120 [Planctomycetota bacterium]|nr:hypothetical protein [Planctomycetota bacterium]